MRKIFSLILKFLMVLSSLGGVAVSLFYYEYDNYTSPAKRLLYFTAQSNIWIGLISLLLAILIIIEFASHRKLIKNWMYVLKYIFTVSIALTGIIFCTILGPKSPDGYHSWSFFSILTHAVAPALALIDFFVDDHKIVFKKQHTLLSLLPPLFYLIFASTLSLLGVDFGHGETFPYFFLNFSSPVGFFGFSNQMPYVMGSFYWIAIFLLIVLGLSLLLIKLHPNGQKGRQKSSVIYKKTSAQS